MLVNSLWNMMKYLGLRLVGVISGVTILLSACVTTNHDTRSTKPVVVLDSTQPTLSVSQIVENVDAADEQSFEIKNDGFLIRAASGGKLDEVRALLDEGTDVNASNRFRTTPLLVSSNNGHTAVVQFLLEKGALVDSRSFRLWPLLAAVKEGHTEIAEILLNAGADTELRDGKGKTVLMHAIIENKIPLFGRLIAAGANVNAVSSEDNPTSPLVLAIDYGRTDMVKQLVESGAELKHPADDKPLLLHAKKRQQQLDTIVEWFGEKSN